MRRPGLLAAGLVLLAAGLAPAQAPPRPTPTPSPTPSPRRPPAPAGTPSPAAPEASPTPSPAPTPAPEYRLGAGDVLEVIVFGNDDLSRTTTVQTTGSISLPLLGEVPVAGLTVAEAKQKLTSLLARDFLVNPQVEMKIKEYQSQFVTVLGEVNSPGRKGLRGRTRLIDVLVDSGGFTPRASGEVSITRAEGTFDGGASVLRLRFGSASPSAIDQINMEQVLRNGDVVNALPKFYVTVEGEIARPGRYVLDGDLTVTGAISTAGGLTRYGKNDVQVRRVDVQTGKTTIIEVDLKDVRKGKKPDLPLLPNDVVTVPRRIF
jgi:polysaccharide export outer membrane protein